jgi:alpha-maltose-1-phosphate synthase
VVGSRGIPNIQGGVETHCEELYPRLVNSHGNQVTVLCRTPYVVDKALGNYKGVHLKNIYTPKTKALEAIIHSVLCVIYAAVKRPDVVHIHAVGPSLVAPLARLLGLKVVMTHHGPDYERKKWGKAAKAFLKAGEWAGATFSNKIIVISTEIKNAVAKKFGRSDAFLIPNGVDLTPEVRYDQAVFSKYDLVENGYIFTLGRFVPEKGFDYLIRAFQKSNAGNLKLVIAGDADHETEYSRSLKEQAKDAGVILTGFIKGNDLRQVFSNCSLFILPSFYEGLPIALLEAMAYQLPIIASDIPANVEVELPATCYFKVGDENALSDKISTFVKSALPKSRIEYDMSKYNWDTIAQSTNEVYMDL